MPTRLEELQALSDEELVELLKPLFAQMQEQGTADASRGGLLGSIAATPAVEPTGRETLQEGLLTAGQNIPFSLAERGRELEAVVSSPVQTILGTLGLMKGAGDLFAEQFGASPTPEGQQARQAGSAFAESFTPAEMMRDPTAPISNVASALLPWMPKGATTLGKLGRATRAAADPAGEMVLGAARIGGKVVDPIKQLGDKFIGGMGSLAAEGLGFTTGKQAPRIREAFRAGREGELRAFLSAIGDETTKRKIGEEVIAALRDEEKRLGGAKGDFVDAYAEAPINTQGLLDEVLGVLGEQNIRRTDRRDRVELAFPEEFSDEAQRSVEKAVRSIASIGDETSLRQLDSKKQAISDLFRAGKREGVATSRINDLVRDRLNTVEGYAEVNKDFSRLKDFFDDLEDDLNIRVRTSKRPQGKPKQAGRGIERAIMEGAEDDLALLQKIEQVTGLPVRAQSAGQGLSQTLPGGMMARFMGAGAVGGAAVGMVPLATLPLFSPRVVGTLTALTGATTAAAQKSVARLRDIARMQPGFRETITVGELFQRLQENPVAIPGDSVENPMTSREDTVLSKTGTMGRDTILSRMGSLGQGRFLRGLRQ